MPAPVTKSERALTILAVAGHDLNNELMVVSGGIVEALAKLPDDDPARTYLLEARDAAQRCCTMAQAMVVFAARHGAQKPAATFNYLIEQEFL